MAKKDDKVNKKVVAETDSNVQGVQEPTQDTPITETETEQPEGSEEKLQIPTEESGSTQTDDKGSAEMDSEAETKGAEEKGDEPSDKVRDQFDKVAKEVFARNHNCDKLFFTSDGIPFYLERDAQRHSLSLDNTTVVPIYK